MTKRSTRRTEIMKPKMIWCGLLMALTAVGAAQEIVLKPVTNVVWIPVTNSPARHIKGPRRWQKECPECGHTSSSTNSSSWTVASSNDPNLLTKFTTVTFKCENPECGEQYRETVQQPTRRTIMVETPPVPEPPSPPMQSKN